MSSRVFVVQEQMRYSPEEGRLVPRFDTIDRAQEFGEIRYVLPNSAHPFQVDENVRIIGDALETFSKDDYLVLVGNPILLGIVTACAAERTHGFVHFLQWSARSGQYIPVPVQMF